MNVSIPLLLFDPKLRKKAEAARTICINIPTAEETLKFIKERLLLGKGFALATINLSHIVRLSYDKAYLKAYAQHDAVVADGFPIVWLARIAGKNIQKTTGSDLVLPLIKVVHETGGSLAMIGTTQATLDIAAERLRKRFPGLRIVLTRSPSFAFDPCSKEAEELLQLVHRRKVSLCLLAFGAPKQEMLAARGMKIAPHTGFASIGASIDFIAGYQIRAPRWIQCANLEWLWRLLSNPRRLFKRYFLCALLLPVLLAREIRNARQLKKKRRPPLPKKALSTKSS